MSVAPIGWLFAFFVALGIFVSTRPPLTFEIIVGRWLRQAFDVARFFAILGYSGPIVLVSVLVTAGAFIVHAPLIPIAVVLAAQVTSQTAVQLAKVIFHRRRPDDWLWRAERGFSYPSGHTVTAMVFYGSWAVLAGHAFATGPAHWAVDCLGVVVVAGIAWSRIALGAHFLSDVIGGFLLAGCWTIAVHRFIG